MSKLYKITKFKDVDNPYHKNSTFGQSKSFHTGIFIKEPEIGERFNLLPYKDSRGISTSPIVRILDEITFETLNSIYEFRPLEDDDDLDEQLVE